VRAQLERRGLALDDTAWKRGRVELPETADYEEWDLRAATERCRELEPQEWDRVLEESLAEAFGSPAPSEPGAADEEGDDGEDDPLAAALDENPVLAELMNLEPRAPSARRSTKPTGARFDPPLERSHIRVQLFNGELAATLSDAVAKRSLGDAAMILVADMGFAETTLQWDDLEKLGLDREEAFLLGRRNAAAQLLHAIDTQAVVVAGARGEILVSNAFFLTGAMLEIRQHVAPGKPLINTPISWHHWVSFELHAGATRDTLKAIRAFVGQLADGITTIRTVSAWVTRSLWWWPTGADEPIVLDLDGELPADLAERLG
jgi:hypothetical protein